MQNIPKIPYFTTSRYRVATMVELARVRTSETAADLGSGDGRISIALAKAGIKQVDAYEIDANLRQLSSNLIKKENIDNINVINKDFWTINLSDYNIIVCYPMPTIMGRLERKLKGELHPYARVLLNYFPFMHWKEEAIKDNIYLYLKK